MPEFLKKQLEAEYPNNPGAVWGTLNKIGAVRGNVETAKGRAMDAKHAHDVKTGKAEKASGKHPHKNLGKYLHGKKGK